MENSFTLFGLTVYPYSLLMVIGGAVTFLLFMALTFKRHKDITDENIFVMEIFSVSVFAALPAAMLADSTFKFIETGAFEIKGATFYGGLIAALALFPCLLLLKKNRQVPVYERLCTLAPCIPAGHFFGRIGCFFGGCCFGSPTDCIFGVTFPKGSIPYEFYGGYVSIHPTQLYEAVFLLVLFSALMLIKKHQFPLYLILYGTGRFIIEFFRNDDRGEFLGQLLSPAQYISSAIIITGLLIIIIKSKNTGQKTGSV